MAPLTDLNQQIQNQRRLVETISAELEILIGEHAYPERIDVKRRELNKELQYLRHLEHQMLLGTAL